MVTSTIRYNGNLITTAIHEFSKTEIRTDAPIDNQGTGTAFSPTDLTAVSLATCILTTIGIVARRENMTTIDGTEADVTKVMYSDPRRIGEIHIDLRIKGGPFSDKEKKLYENAAHACPVAKSLHPSIIQKITFTWP